MPPGTIQCRGIADATHLQGSPSAGPKFPPPHAWYPALAATDSPIGKRGVAKGGTHKTPLTHGNQHSEFAVVLRQCEEVATPSTRAAQGRPRRGSGRGRVPWQVAGAHKGIGHSDTCNSERAHRMDESGCMKNAWRAWEAPEAHRPINGGKRLQAPQPAWFGANRARLRDTKVRDRGQGGESERREARVGGRRSIWMKDILSVRPDDASGTESQGRRAARPRAVGGAWGAPRKRVERVLRGKSGARERVGAVVRRVRRLEGMAGECGYGQKGWLQECRRSENGMNVGVSRLFSQRAQT